MLTVNRVTGAIENCMIFISNGTLNEDITCSRTVDDAEPEHTGSSIVATGNIQMSQYSSLLVDNEGPVAARNDLIGGTFIMHGGTLNSDLHLHASSRAELGDGVMTQSGADIIQLRSVLYPSFPGTLTTNEVVCFGANSAFNDDNIGLYRPLSGVIWRRRSAF